MRSRLARFAAAFGLAAAFAFPTTEARAATVYVIEGGSDAWTLLDPETVTTLPGSQVRRAWIVRVQRSITAKPPFEPGYVRTLTDYDCAAETVRWQEFSAYSRDGKLLGRRVNKTPEWEPVQQATDIRGAYRAVCESGGWKSVISTSSLAKVVVSVMSGWDAPAAPAEPTGRAGKTKAPPAAKPRARSRSADPP